MKFLKRLLWNHLTNFTWFYMGPSVKGMLTICSKWFCTIDQDGCYAHTWEKHLKIFSSTKKALRDSIRDSRSTRFEKMMRLGWHLTYLWYGQMCRSCCGNTERMLHGICKYAMTVFIRWVHCGPWASCLCPHYLKMPLPFEEWWKGHIVLPMSIHLSPSLSSASNLHLSFSGWRILIFWTYF